MHWLAVVLCCGFLVAVPVPALPQVHEIAAELPPHSISSGKIVVLDELRFTGLRHIAPAAVAAQITSRTGDPFDATKLERDVRTLARLGWFESIRVEQISSPAAETIPRIALVFHLQERPILSKVAYSGSRLLSQKQIEKLLDEKRLAPGLGNPADPAALQRIASAIRSTLDELAHPQANVLILREESPNATVSVRFEIRDGPRLPVRRVEFSGHPSFSPNLLRGQMRSIAPGKPFSSWRGKDAYTRESFEEDRQRLLTFYQNHGFPQARVGSALVASFNCQHRQWLPWPHEANQSALTVTIPVEAGSFYRFKSLEASAALQQAVQERSGRTLVPPPLEQDSAFSQQQIDRVRRSWQAYLSSKNSNLDPLLSRSVGITRAFDPETQTVAVKFDLGNSPPYTVRRIEFLGLHKFSDRYVRRRILLREGHPLDDRLLEAGLLRLTRTGYFKPIHKEDIRVQLDEPTRSANVTIRLEEIGQQRASLVGGTGQFGSTLGVVYTVFDLLNREELLSAQLEGGPQTLQVLLSIAKEGVFGTRGSLAFSIFYNVVRPRLASSPQGPFFSSHSEGITVPWSYPLSATDSLAINYTLSRTTTEYPLSSSTTVPGVTLGDVRSKVSSRALGAGWVRDTGSERVLLSDTFSGSFLGGDENMLRSSAEYSRIFRDPFVSPSHSWAFRTALSGAGSYRGDMPFYARFFSGDELVRGFRPGELGPYAVTTKTAASGASTYSASPAGANLLGAANAEYRVPLGGNTEAVGFFDLGSGRLLPNWLGPTKPLLLSATNGVLHGSTGIEIRWTVPGVQVPVRAYYAFNVLRLDRSLPLAGKSFFQARNRFSAFGWGLGSLF